MNSFDYQLGKLQGQLEAFIYINAKTNHSYDFEICRIIQEDCLLLSAEKHLKQYYPNGVVLGEKLVDWKSRLSQCLERWLFDFVYKGDQTFKGDYLRQHKYGGFNCFDAESRMIFALDFCQAIDEIFNIEEAVEVFLETDEWYEACWNDFVLKGRNGTAFIHLGVSD